MKFFDYLDERKYPHYYHAFLLALFAVFISFALLASISPERVKVKGQAIPTICVFKLSTGLDCPACGITRSVILALHGDFRAAYLMHIWGIPVALLFLIQIPYRIYRILGGRPYILPPWLKSWGFRFVLLSLFLPWIVKTAMFYIH